MKSKFKALKIAAKADSGVRDVSVDHDSYLAEFTYARKVAGPKATGESTRPARTGREGSSDSSACASCGTTRYPLKARGMCGRCYNAQRHLDQIERWNLSDEQSLKGYPPGAMYRNPKKLALLQFGHRKEWQRRLSLLRLREKRLRGPIGGKDLEDQLGRIARLAGAKKNLFDGVAGPVGQCFGPEQRSRLYELLNRIEESVPWRGINQFRALSEPYVD
jgi:hypothetical protein